MTPIVVFDSSLEWQTCFGAWHGGCLQPPFISFGDYGLGTVNIQLATKKHSNSPIFLPCWLASLLWSRFASTFFCHISVSSSQTKLHQNQNITSRNEGFSIFSTTFFHVFQESPKPRETKELGHLPIPVVSKYHCHQYQGLGKPDRNHQPMIEDTEYQENIQGFFNTGSRCPQALRKSNCP